MKLFPRSLASTIALALFAACAPAQITKTAKGYLMRVKYVPGTVIRYDSSSSVANKQSPLGSVSIGVPITYTVLGVAKGLATVRLNIGAGKISGNPSPVTEPQRFELKLDSQNRPTQATGPVPGSPGALPDHPIEPGSTWNAVAAFNVGGSIQKLQGVYRFAGLKTEDGRLLAIITYQLSGAVSGTGVMKLLAKDGSMVTNETNLSLKGDQIYLLHTLVKRRL